jgi:ATP-dependent helicase/DNAse subunit B
MQIARRDLTGWRGMIAIVQDWSEAVTRWREGGETLTVEQFDARLREMLNGDAVFWSETHRGVRVLEGLAAAYRSFTHVFLVGLSGDHLPKRVPTSPLFTEEERAQLAEAGLPLDLKSVWDRREQALFRQLVAAASVALTASFPSLDESGRETVPSAFLEELLRVARHEVEAIPSFRVLTPRMPLIREWSAALQAQHAAAIERQRVTGILGPWSGQIEDPALVGWLQARRGEGYLWSPTQLESYAKCPWAYFSGRILGLQKLEDPDEDMDRTIRGALLHEALQRFFNTAGERQSGPVLLRAGDLGWATAAMADALDQALLAQPASVWLGHPALRPARREEMLGTLLEYLRWETGETEATFEAKTRKKKAAERVRTAVESHEVEIADARLERNGVTLRYRGRIDRVEIGVDDRVDGANHLVAAVDYKSSKAATPGGGDRRAWEDGVVLQIPLYAHALTQLRPRSEVARVEYRVLSEPGTVHNLDLIRVDRNGGTLRPQEDAAEKMAAALDRAVEHVKAVRRGEFPANPPPSCHCPDWCHGFEICRVPGGPRRKAW